MARRASNGLDALGTTMLPIPNQRVDLRIDGTPAPILTRLKGVEGCSYERAWWRASRVLWVLELYQANTVLARVDEPGHPGEPDIGNAVFGL